MRPWQRLLQMIVHTDLEPFALRRGQDMLRAETITGRVPSYQSGTSLALDGIEIVFVVALCLAVPVDLLGAQCET